MTNAKVLLLVLSHAHIVRFEMIIDARVGPGHVPGTAGDLADVLLDLLCVPVLLPVLLQVHPVLGVDVADVAHLGCEVPLTRDAGEA